MKRKFMHLRLMTVVYLVISAANASEKEQSEIIEYSAQLRTLNYEKSQKELAKYISSSDGYLVSMNKYSLVAYVPAGKKIEELSAEIQKSGYLVSSSVHKENPLERIKDLELLLDVKTKHRKEVLKLLNGADTSSTLDIEVELGEIMQQIENMTGELKYLKERQKMTKLSIRFDIVHHASPEAYKDFSWLEKMNIPSFIQRFE